MRLGPFNFLSWSFAHFCNNRSSSLVDTVLQFREVLPHELSAVLGNIQYLEDYPALTHFLSLGVFGTLETQSTLLA